MERDKVIEFALKVDPDFQACKEDMYESLLGIEVVAAFAALVEKETLERAAKVCDDASEFAITSAQESSFIYCATKIRNLKDNP